MSKQYDVKQWVASDIELEEKLSTSLNCDQLLSPEHTAIYTAQHTVTQEDIDAGDLLSNHVTVTATMVKPETSVSVGDIIVTESLENPVETTLNSTSSIDVTKVADVSDKNNDGYTGYKPFLFALRVNNSTLQIIFHLRNDRASRVMPT